jgi:hypothetical protein
LIKCAIEDAERFEEMALPAAILDKYIWLARTSMALAGPGDD